MLPETCLAGDLIGRCITFIDQWELLLAVLSSVLIGSALCRDSPPDIRKGVTISISVFAFLVTQAAIAEYGMQFSAIYFPVMAVLSFTYFVNSLLGFRRSSGGGEPGRPGGGTGRPGEGERHHRDHRHRRLQRDQAAVGSDQDQRAGSRRYVGAGL